MRMNECKSHHFDERIPVRVVVLDGNGCNAITLETARTIDEEGCLHANAHKEATCETV